MTEANPTYCVIPTPWPPGKTGNHEDRKGVSGFQGVRGREWISGAQRIFQAVRSFLFDTLVVDACHCILVTHPAQPHIQPRTGALWQAGSYPSPCLSGPAPVRHYMSSVLNEQQGHRGNLNPSKPIPVPGPPESESPAGESGHPHCGVSPRWLDCEPGLGTTGLTKGKTVKSFKYEKRNNCLKILVLEIWRKNS